MKIITLWQPWASLVAYGLKHYETRSWATNYRGPLLIHAAKRPFVHPISGKVLCQASNLAWLDAIKHGYESGLIGEGTRFPSEIFPFAHQLPLGAVVAIAQLTDCRPMGDIDGFDDKRRQYLTIKGQTAIERTVGDWSLGRYAWKLNNIQLLEPTPWKGAQGLREVPDELRRLVA
ncbi:MAG: ASCH domain-containing protein [Cyanobacteria bacterium P01_F01_bin.3]